jgi:methyltransferase (TIGR00027 family)
MAEPLIQHVSDTAFMVAHHRAVESARKDALFADPLAQVLAGERGRAIAEGISMGRIGAWNVSLRTRIIDEYVLAEIAGGIDTVVNLGAGLDTRPYRLDLPAALQWVEVDYPAVIALKQERLAGQTPRCLLERVGLDLAQVAARRELIRRLDAGARRMLVITEGVIPYLDVAEVASLADDLRAATHLEGWIVDYVSPQAIAYRKRMPDYDQMRQAPFRFEPPDWDAFFAAHGWRCREMRYLIDEGERHGRRPPLPWRLRALIRLSRILAPSQSRRTTRAFGGYALLARTAGQESR